MKRLTWKASIYLILAAFGTSAVVYSIKVGNYVLLVAAILFALVSLDNIFCNLNITKKRH